MAAGLAVIGTSGALSVAALRFGNNGADSASVGAGIVEVQIRLQKCLAGLAAVSAEHRHVFTAAADDALRRAKRAMHRDDFLIVRAAAREAWGLRAR